MYVTVFGRYIQYISNTSYTPKQQQKVKGFDTWTRIHEGGLENRKDGSQ